MLSRSLKIKQARLSHSHYRHSRLSDAESRLSESSCRGDPLLPPFSPKRVQRLPISLKRDPFFSLKYSCSPKRDVGFSTSRPSERLSSGWRMLSRSSETWVAWARLRGYICFMHQKVSFSLEFWERRGPCCRVDTRSISFSFSSSSS